MTTPSIDAACDPAAVARNFDLARVPVDFIDNPYRYYDVLRTHDPIHAMPNSVLLTRYDDVVAVYRDRHASSDKKTEFRPKLGNSPLYEHHTTSLVFNDPPLHTRVRRLIMGALNQKAIARMEADVVRLVDTLLDRMLETREVNFIDAFAADIPIEVIGNLLNVPRSERGPLRSWSTRILSRLEPTLSRETLEGGNRAVTEFLDFLEVLVAERRRNPGDYETDVLTRLVQGGQDGEKLTEKELYHQCIFLLNAGHETTTNLIGNGMWLLLTHPEELARLRADPGLLPGAIEEMLRHEGPIQLNNRHLTAPINLGGRTLPEGTSITIAIGAANRDPTRFPEPGRFDVARQPNRHVAFGHGVHACSGMNVARMEARVAFGRLLARLRSIEPADEPQRDLRIRFRGFRDLPVRVR